MNENKSKNRKNDLLKSVMILLTGFFFLLLGTILKTSPSFMKGFTVGYFSILLIIMVIITIYRIITKKGFFPFFRRDERQTKLNHYALSMAFFITIMGLAVFEFILFSKIYSPEIGLKDFIAVVLGIMGILYGIIYFIYSKVY
jgi:hypothetical protein